MSMLFLQVAKPSRPLQHSTSTTCQRALFCQAMPGASRLAAGQPYLENVKVQAQIVEELKGKKVIVYKMRPKKHYQKKNGHRQPLTKFMVTKISKA